MGINYLKKFFDRFRSFYVKTKRFIKIMFHKYHLATKGYLIKTFPKTKIKSLIGYIINVIFTGLLLQYTITGTVNFNFARYGFASASIMFYINWLVKTIKYNRDLKK